MAKLAQTIEDMNLPVPDEETLARLTKYCRALWQENESVNLTRHTTYEKFVSRDLIDTIEVGKLIPLDKTVIDMGSGGGVPGMLLAILRPDLSVSLTESVGKKAVALESIAAQVGVEVEIYNTRAEKMLEDFSYDYTTARAVGPLYKICTWLQDVWPSAGRVLAIKGPNWTNERNVAAEKGLLKKTEIEVVSQYAPPGTEWESVILQLTIKRKNR